MSDHGFGASPFFLMRCQDLKLGLLVIPAPAGIQIAALDSRLRGNDGTRKSSIDDAQAPFSVLGGLSAIGRIAVYFGSKFKSVRLEANRTEVPTQTAPGKASGNSECRLDFRHTCRHRLSA
jgi:hypothetical protein